MEKKENVLAPSHCRDGARCKFLSVEVAIGDLAHAPAGRCCRGTCNLIDKYSLSISGFEITVPF